MRGRWVRGMRGKREEGKGGGGERGIAKSSIMEERGKKRGMNKNCQA